jgi:hypothetical protein
MASQRIANCTPMDIVKASQFVGGASHQRNYRMNAHNVTRYLFYVLAVLLFAGFSVAQSSDSSDHVEVFGGYSYMNPDFTSTVSGGVSGWDISATFRVVRYAGIVADFSGFRPTGADPCHCGAPFADIHTFLFGPQASISIGRIKPFAHFLMGAAEGSITHGDSQFGGDFSYFTYGAGGGVDFGLNRDFALRSQLDWLHLGSQTPSNVARVSAGLVFRF